jgi:Holliday junction resolvase RusA-like endonuclease
MIKILGNIPSKSNSYVPVTVGGGYDVQNGKLVKGTSSSALKKGQKIRDYEMSFLAQLPWQYKGINYAQKFAVVGKVFFKNKASDLDNALKIILDCLEKADVIENDRNCYAQLVEKVIDKENPRIELELYEYAEGLVDRFEGVNILEVKS